MSKTTDKTDLILPIINQALKTAGQQPAQVIPGIDGVSHLLFSTGDSLKIHQLGVLTASMLPMLKENLHPNQSILWCQFIGGDVLAQELSKREICYADTAGNMLLRFHGNFLQIRNCPKPKTIAAELARGRSLTPSGLMVLFLLLTEPQSVIWNYRLIAANSGTTIGTVNYVMSDLRQKHYLLEDDTGRRLVNLKSLSRLWVDHYRLKLLPKLKSRRYSGTLKTMDPADSLIPSGETVANQEGLLKTDHVLLWNQTADYARTVARNHWHLAPDGPIEIREAFWPTDKRLFTEHVPWLLVYADLLATEDGRCLETAESIRQQHLGDLT